MTSLVHHHGILERLLNQRRNATLTDFELIYKDQRIPCHKDIVSILSSTIGEQTDATLVIEPLLAENDATTDVLEAVTEALYGQPLEININVLEVIDFATSLRLGELVSLCTQSITSRTDKTFVSSFTSILERLQNDHHREFSLVYRNITITIHRFLLAALCPIFLSRFALEPDDNEWNLTDFLTVQESSFEDFFTSFYRDEVAITLDNLFDFSHLAFYFQMPALVSSCDSFMNSAEPLVDWIFPGLESADKAGDLIFVDKLVNVMSRLDDLAQCDPIAVKPEVFTKLCSSVDVHWLIKVLVYSYIHYNSIDSQRVWTVDQFERGLEQIDTSAIAIDLLYSIISPLLEVEELCHVFSKFSLSRFTTEQLEIPSEWLVWLMVELDKQEPPSIINPTTMLPFLIPSIFTREKLSIMPPLVLHPRSLRIYLANISEGYIVLWFIQCLISSFNVENDWTFEIFEEILSLVNLETLDLRKLIAVLRPIENNIRLQEFYYRFVSNQVTPLIIRDYTRTVGELEIAQQALQEVTFLQSEVVRLNTMVTRHADIIHQEEERLAYIANPLSFIASNRTSFYEFCGGQIKFLADTLGSNLSLVNNLCVEKQCEEQVHSFVAINHPPTGQVVLKCENGPKFCCIGMFNPDYAQGSEPFNQMRGIRVHGQCIFLHKEELTNHVFCTCNNVLIEFRESHFAMSFLPLSGSVTFDYVEGWVFGIHLQDSGESWSIDLSSNERRHRQSLRLRPH
ncbi:hypothetical protein RCL1_005518 [Eukaryota sp. TZLM3-RCL]